MNRESEHVGLQLPPEVTAGSAPSHPHLGHGQTQAGHQVDAIFEAEHHALHHRPREVRQGMSQVEAEERSPRLSVQVWRPFAAEVRQENEPL